MERKNKINQVGIVIPTYNEEGFIWKLLSDLKNQSFEEIVVVDANSSDRTVEMTNEFNITVISSPLKSRAFQMNLGAKSLNVEYLLFLHADVTLPSDFHQRIQKQLKEQQFDLANFQLRFNSNHWFLKLNALFSKLESNPFQFGDQGLAINSQIFKLSDGFNESLLFMEGNEIIRRLRKGHTFRKLPIEIYVSDRKYQKHGIFKLQFSYYLIYLLDQIGIPQEKIKKLFSIIL